MKLVDIYKSEHNRNGDYSKLYFYREGDKSPWFRAYEWSAYLAKKYPNGLDEQKRLKESRSNFSEDENGIVKVGIQLASMQKFFPNAVVVESDEKHFVIAVDLAQYDTNGGDVDTLFLDWKKSIEIKTASPKKKNPVVSRTSSLSSIMKKILSYRVEQSSSEDNVDFICELKEMCADLI